MRQTSGPRLVPAIGIPRPRRHVGDGYGGMNYGGRRRFRYGRMTFFVRALLLSVLKVGYNSAAMRSSKATATILLLCFLAACLVNCGSGASAGGSSSPTPPPHPTSTITSVTVTIAGTVSTVLGGQRLYVNATVKGTGDYSSGVTYSVNGIANGDSQNGTISSNGTYTAPSAVPAMNPVTITATSTEDPTKSGSATATVFSVVISPANPTLKYGSKQQFTATVTAISNPVVQWTALYGSITSAGLYTAPSPGTAVAGDTLYALVEGTTTSVSTVIEFEQIPPQLNSISPDKAIVGQTVTLNATGLYNVTQVFFPLPDGNSIAATFTADSTSKLTATVPVGTVTGPVFVQYTSVVGGGTSAVTNSVNFTRLPNLHIRAQSKELSSGETTQFLWSFLGGTTTSAIQWTADQGTITSAGLYSAPAVSSEQFVTVTACISGSEACDAVMVHVLPFRISPSSAVATLGSSLQMEAVQAGLQLSATWSLPAGDGQINSGGLFTAAATGPQGGYVPVNATSGGNTEGASVAVTGGFPGLVNRVWDYVNLGNPGNLGMLVESVAVSGNRAYCIDVGAPYANQLSYAAIDVYDISNPSQPVWLTAVDSATTSPQHIFTYGDYLVTVAAPYGDQAPTFVAIYNIANQVPVLQSVTALPEMVFTQVSGGIIYGLAPGVLPPGSTTVPVYTFDVRTGTVIQNIYNLPPPAGITVGFVAVTGSGNTIYASQANPAGIDEGWAFDEFDISTSPPTLVSWIPSLNSGFTLQVANQLLFADGYLYDFSTASPTLVTGLPIAYVTSVAGNQVLAVGDYFDYLVIDVSNPESPQVTQDVADIASESPFIFQNGVISGANIFGADAFGGLAIFDISVPGGPINGPPNPSYELDNGLFYQIFGQMIQSPTLYVAGSQFTGGGGLITFDTSSAQPVALGKLLYTSEYGTAVQVSGTTAFLGLNDKLKIVDVSDVSNPVEIGSVSTPIAALAISGTTLFGGTSDGHLVVFDVTNPTSPNQIANISLPGAPTTLRLSGSSLFVADGVNGLLIFDVSQPSSPVEQSQFALSAPIWDSAVSGTTALLAADALGLVVADVSNPAQVQQLSQTALPVFNGFPAPNSTGSVTLAVSIAIQNGLGYVGTSTNDPDDASDALATFDFSQPVSPRLVGFRRQTLDSISVITPSGNNMFLADGGVVTEFDNSIPYNSIQLDEPPAALAKAPLPVSPTKIWKSRNVASADQRGRRRGASNRHSLAVAGYPPAADQP